MERRENASALSAQATAVGLRSPAELRILINVVAAVSNRREPALRCCPALSCPGLRAAFTAGILHAHVPPFCVPQLWVGLQMLGPQLDMLMKSCVHQKLLIYSKL